METQSTALFGDVKQLTRQMQEAVGKDVNSLEEVMQRVQQAVEQEKVKHVAAVILCSMHYGRAVGLVNRRSTRSLLVVLQVDVMQVTVATQRRAVLEAIAFGSFLRDVETYVDSEYQLLTPGSSGWRRSRWSWANEPPQTMMTVVTMATATVAARSRGFRVCIRSSSIL